MLGGNCHRPAGQQQKTDDDDDHGSGFGLYWFMYLCEGLGLYPRRLADQRAHN